MPVSQTAVILAGGRGTRLGALTQNTPKPLLPIGGKPFIFYILDHLKQQKMNTVILATGYLASSFEKILGYEYRGMKIIYSRENEPLGTGGALSQALQIVEEENVFVLNGDTFFKAHLRKLEETLHYFNTSISIMLRKVEDTTRYGRVEFENQKILSIREKGIQGPGYVNGGIYLIKKNCWPLFKEKNYSFELDVLPSMVTKQEAAFLISDDYFIDIGIPEDLKRAKKELAPFFSN